MIRLLLILLILLLPTVAHGLTIERLGLEARSRIPHNERVVDRQSTVYVLAGDLRLRLHPHLWTQIDAVTYGVQRWRPVAANGYAAWSAADWGVSSWRPSWSLRVGVPIKWGVSLIADYGRCLWCSTPEGRYFGEIGLRWEPQFLTHQEVF